MKKFLFVLLIFAPYVVAMDKVITLPEYEVMRVRFQQSGEYYFAEKTDLLPKLYKSEYPRLRDVVTIPVAELVEQVETCMPDHPRENFPVARTQRSKFLEILLQDRPDLLEELKQAGRYKTVSEIMDDWVRKNRERKAQP